MARPSPRKVAWVRRSPGRRGHRSNETNASTEKPPNRCRVSASRPAKASASTFRRGEIARECNTNKLPRQPLKRLKRRHRSVTLSAEHPFAPKGRRNVATGGVRRSRTEPVVFGDKSQPAPKGAAEPRRRRPPPPPPGRAPRRVGIHGLRFARLEAGGAPPVATILGPSGTVPTPPKLSRILAIPGED